MTGTIETNVPYKKLLTDREVSTLRKTFANNSSADKKLLKTQTSKITKSGRFLGRLLGILIKSLYL